MATVAPLQIDLVGHTAFDSAPDLDWQSDVDDSAALVEFAGRACYETWDKPLSLIHI